MEGTTETGEDTYRVDAVPRNVVAAAYAALEAHAARIDALNVYPVPDGDTGTNMLLTLRSVLEAVSDVPSLSEEAATRAIARAALMGARGNSGVILSQMLRGACEVLSKARVPDAGVIAEALVGAKDQAYATVRKPVEGTMLSVMKDAADAARLCVEQGERDPLEVLRAATREAHASVRRTPDLLAVLKEAGVVDAGGLGVAVILDGILAALSGEELVLDLEEAAPARGGESLRDTVAHSAQEAWGYCTQFVVSGFTGDEREFEEHVQEIGQSVLVISDRDLVKVHLHIQDPGSALTYAGRFGRLGDVKIEDMEAQIRSREDRSEEAPGSTGQLAVVVASRGEGSRQLFESMGAVVIEGGQSANPSAEDFTRAIERTGADTVILLPNNRNVLLVAERVQELVRAEVHVVATTSIAGGLAVMVAFEPDGDPEEVVQEMREISEELWCAEVTRAVREARVDGREVCEGDYMGFLDGELLAVEGTVEDAALRLIEGMVEEGADVVTLLTGYGLDKAVARRISEKVKLIDDEIEVEIKTGGQPLYPLQMVAE